MSVVLCNSYKCINNISGECSLEKIKLQISTDGWSTECMNETYKKRPLTKDSNSKGFAMVQQMTNNERGKNE